MYYLYTKIIIYYFFFNFYLLRNNIIRVFTEQSKRYTRGIYIMFCTIAIFYIIWYAFLFKKKETTFHII